MHRIVAAGRLAPCRRLSSPCPIRHAMPKVGLSLESTTQLRLAVSCSELSFAMKYRDGRVDEEAPSIIKLFPFSFSRLAPRKKPKKQK